MPKLSTLNLSTRKVFGVVTQYRPQAKTLAFRLDKLPRFQTPRSSEVPSTGSPTLDTPFFQDARAIDFVRRHPRGAEVSDVARALGVGPKLIRRIEASAFASLRANATVEELRELFEQITDMD